MPAASINCPNCGHRLATVDLGSSDRLASVSAPTGHPDPDARQRRGRVPRHLQNIAVGLIAKGEVRVVMLGRSIRVPWQELEGLSDGAP